MFYKLMEGTKYYKQFGLTFVCLLSIQFQNESNPTELHKIFHGTNLAAHHKNICVNCEYIICRYD